MPCRYTETRNYQLFPLRQWFRWINDRYRQEKWQRERRSESGGIAVPLLSIPSTLYAAEGNHSQEMSEDTKQASSVHQRFTYNRLAKEHSTEAGSRGMCKAWYIHNTKGLFILSLWEPYIHSFHITIRSANVALYQVEKKKLLMSMQSHNWLKVNMRPVKKWVKAQVTWGSP